MSIFLSDCLVLRRGVVLHGIYVSCWSLDVRKRELSSHKMHTHIHLLVKAKNQKDLHNFLRVLTGQIAQRITGAVRGRKNRFGFWLKRADFVSTQEEKTAARTKNPELIVRRD